MKGLLEISNIVRIKILWSVLSERLEKSMEDGRSMATFYYCSVNHQYVLQRNTFLNVFLNTYINMCAKLYHLVWGIWWFHGSKCFEAMKAGKLAIRPRLSCQYSKNMLMDLPSSVKKRCLKKNTSKIKTKDRIINIWLNFNRKKSYFFKNFYFWASFMFNLHAYLIITNFLKLQDFELKSLKLFQ